MPQERAIKPKVLADGVEAMLGAYLIAGGLKSALALLAAFGILPMPQDFNYPVRFVGNEAAEGSTIGLLTPKVSS